MSEPAGPGTLSAVAGPAEHLQLPVGVAAGRDGPTVVGSEIRVPVRRPPPAGAPITAGLTVRPDGGRAALLLDMVARQFGWGGLAPAVLLVALMLCALREGL